MLVLLLLQGVRHNCGTLQQFWVVFLVLCLPANSHSSVDALVQDPSSFPNPGMAGARDQDREGVAVCFLVFEISPGNAAWLSGSPFFPWDGL